MSDTKALDEVTKLVVDIANGVRGAIANKSNYALDLALILPIITDAPAVVADAGLLGAEIKGLDAAGLAQVKADALAILAAAEGAAANSKLIVYVNEAVNILISVLNIFKA